MDDASHHPAAGFMVFKSLPTKEQKISKSWGRRHPILLGVLIIFGLLYIVGRFGDSDNNSSTKTSKSSSLNVEVKYDVKIGNSGYGITVQNFESTDLSDCVVGINGSCGWDYNKLPYRTLGNFTIPTGKTVSILYGELFTDKGVKFDTNATDVVSVTIICSKTTSPKVFCGNPTNVNTSRKETQTNSSSPIPKTTIKSVPLKTAIPTPKPVSISIDYSQFQSMHIEDYAKNPPFYYGKQIKIRSAFVKDFLAKNDRGGSTNWIDVLDGSNLIIPTEVVLKIDDTILYQKATSSLNKGDYINVYGIGEKSSNFTSSSGDSSTLPAIKILRIDKCDMYAGTICVDGSIETIFSQ